MEIVCATYNIRHGENAAGVIDLAAIAGVIKSSGATIVGLNEVDDKMRRSGAVNQAAWLADSLQMNYIFAPALVRGQGRYGNALLTKYPIVRSQILYLPKYDNSEQRCCLIAELDVAGQIITVCILHLSVKQNEIALQLKTLDELTYQLKPPVIMMGDFNVTSEQIGRIENLHELTAAVPICTFPAHNPTKAIDHIFVSQHLVCRELSTINIPTSDHLLLYAKIQI